MRAALSPYHITTREAPAVTAAGRSPGASGSSDARASSSFCRDRS